MTDQQRAMRAEYGRRGGWALRGRTKIGMDWRDPVQRAAYKAQKNREYREQRRYAGQHAKPKAAPKPRRKPGHHQVIPQWPYRPGSLAFGLLYGDQAVR